MALGVPILKHIRVFQSFQADVSICVSDCIDKSITLQLFFVFLHSWQRKDSVQVMSQTPWNLAPLVAG